MQSTYTYSTLKLFQPPKIPNVTLSYSYKSYGGVFFIDNNLIPLGVSYQFIPGLKLLKNNFVIYPRRDKIVITYKNSKLTCFTYSGKVIITGKISTIAEGIAHLALNCILQHTEGKFELRKWYDDGPHVIFSSDKDNVEYFGLNNRNTKFFIKKFKSILKTIMVLS